MKKSTLVLVGLVSFLLTSATQMPAKLLISRLPANFPLKLEGVTGSLWQGSANSVRWRNISFSQFQWDIQLSGLFKGLLAAQISAIPNTGGKISGLCGMSLLGKKQCQDLKLTDIPAQAMTPYLQSFSMPEMRGLLQGEFTWLTLKTGIPNGSGRIEWQNAGSALQAGNMGNYTATFTPSSNGQEIKLNSTPDAVFAVDGQINLDEEGKYQANISIKPDATKAGDAGMFLGMLGGTPQEDGSFKLEKQGELHQ